MQTAIAYIRVSGQRQVAEGNSLVSQEKLALSHALKKGYAVDKVFIERGESAKSVDRTVLQDMLAYCRANAGKIQVLLFPKIDRLARYTYDYTRIKEEMKGLGIRFESIGEHFDDSPAGRLTEFMLAAIAQFDNEVRAERCKGGMIQAVSEGRHVWKAPFGYRNVKVNGKGTIEPDEDVKPKIQEVFRQIARGHFCLKSAREWLLHQGISISPAHLHRMLYNKVYLGIMESFGGRYHGKPPFVPLIDAGTFFAAQMAVERRLNRPRTYDRNNPDFPLRGVLKCGCGSTLTGCWSKGKTAPYAYYRCTKCRRVNLGRETLEKAFIRELDLLAVNEGKLKSLYPELLEAWQRQNAHSLVAAQRTQEEIAEYRQTQQAIVLKSAKDVIPDELAKIQIEALEHKIAELEWSLNSAGEVSDIRDVFKEAIDFLTSIGQKWRSGSLSAKKSIQSFLYPNGLVYTKDDGFRTSDYPLLELAKDLFGGGQSLLVDPTKPKSEFSAELATYLHHLTAYASALREAELKELETPDSGDPPVSPQLESGSTRR